MQHVNYRNSQPFFTPLTAGTGSEGKHGARCGTLPDIKTDNSSTVIKGGKIGASASDNEWAGKANGLNNEDFPTTHNLKDPVHPCTPPDHGVRNHNPKIPGLSQVKHGGLDAEKKMMI